MKWIPLKMHYLPLVFQEINNVTEEYIGLLSKIREKIKKQEDNNSEMNNNNQIEEEEKEDREDEFEIIIKKYNGLRVNISKRINELEDFYEENIDDVRVSNFEKARLKLKKLLMYSYDNINRVENGAHTKNIFVKEVNNKYYKKINEETKQKIMENNIATDRQRHKEKKKKEVSEKKKLDISEQKLKKKEIKKIVNPKKIEKVSGDEGFLRPLSKRKNSDRDRFVKDSDVMGKMLNDDYSNCREIMFKIKMSPSEYCSFVKEKKSKGSKLQFK